MIINTFRKNFPHQLVFISPRKLGAFLVGSESRISLNKKRVDLIIKFPNVYNDMSELSGNPYTFESLNKLYLGSETELSKFTGNVPFITDYFPRTEYSLLRNAFHASSNLTGAEFIRYFK